MPKYSVRFAHNNDNATDESVQWGWGTVDIETDHAVVTEADRTEVARQIGRAGGYTAVGIQSIKRTDIDPNELDATHFVTVLGEDGAIPAVILGDDQWIAFWGHDVDELEAASVIHRYAAWSGITSTIDDVLDALKDTGLQRVNAWKLITKDDDDEVSIAWGDVPSGRRTYPVTLVNLDA